MNANHSDSIKVIRKLGITFVCAGVFLMIVALASYMIIEQTLSGYSQAQAIITDVALSHTTVSYMSGEQLFGISLNESNSAWRTGDTLTVYYDPNDPATVTTGIIGWLLPMIFGIIGGVFLVLGTVFYTHTIRMEDRHIAR